MSFSIRGEGAKINSCLLLDVAEGQTSVPSLLNRLWTDMCNVKGSSPPKQLFTATHIISHKKNTLMDESIHVIYRTGRKYNTCIIIYIKARTQAGCFSWSPISRHLHIPKSRPRPTVLQIKGPPDHSTCIRSFTSQQAASQGENIWDISNPHHFWRPTTTFMSLCCKQMRNQQRATMSTKKTSGIRYYRQFWYFGCPELLPWS